MTDIIQCPNCGRETHADLEFCQFCKARLDPVTGALKSEDKPITPGQVPSQKSTSDLEPLLPKWLQDARTSSREGEQPAAPPPKPAAPQPPAKKTNAANDFLAGLQTNAADDEDEEIPDWLANITGGKPAAPKNEQSAETHRVEMGGISDFARDEPAAETPSWLADLQSPTPQQEEEKDELTDWLRNASQESQPATFLNTPAADDSADWLKSMAADAAEPAEDFQAEQPQPFASDDTPDWLSNLSADATPTADFQTEQPQPSTSDDTPDWLSNLSADAEPTADFQAQQPQPSTSDDTPDWLSNLSADATPTADFQTEQPQPSTSDDTPDWLKSLDSAAAGQPTPELHADVYEDAPELPLDALDTVDWLKSLDDAAAEQAASAEPASIGETGRGESEAEAAPLDMPDWMQSSATEETPTLQESTPPWLKGNAAEAEIPAWLAGVSAEDAAQQTSFESAVEMPQVEPAPAEMPISFDAAPPENMDGLFTDMPDWLSSAMEQPASAAAPTPITNEDALSPSELPSWVQAMRPVDPGTPQSVSLSSDQSLETRGALAGLQGVLPAVQGFTPTSKPRAHSIRLNATDEQKSHADILEQILAAETAPVPLESFQLSRPSRGLRWGIAIVLLAAITFALALQTRIFSMPVLAPNEALAAISIAQALPPNAPVLVAVDYETSRATEMEAAAAPMFDNLMLLKAPRLTFVATNETGAMLAERLLAGPLAGHNYQSGVTYLNLGYLPGGQLGIRAFAQRPTLTMPIDIFEQPAWSSPVLQGVTALDQFAAIILITDNAESARSWVEQTEGRRGAAPFLVISSAQATPMIQPYYDSQQVAGIVPGLYGGAIFEQYNAGRPGTARNYWDAYSLGMLLAAALVAGGGLWNLVMGMRERAAQEGN